MIPTLELAEYLDQALLEGHEVERISIKYADFNLQDAYAIQDAGIARRMRRGERLAGFKMGFTSEAKRQQMGLGSPIYGALTDKMAVEEGSAFSLQGSIHPKIEPEIVFYLERELRGRVTAQEAWNACAGVGAALEILDSRFVGFKYFSLEDVIADNCSSSRYVLGRTVLRPDEVSIGDLEMEMKINGQPVAAARSSAISGHPIQSLVQLCELLADRGLALPAGSIVLAGAATQAVAIEPGMRVELRVEKFGSVQLEISA